MKKQVVSVILLGATIVISSVAVTTSALASERKGQLRHQGSQQDSDRRTTARDEAIKIREQNRDAKERESKNQMPSKRRVWNPRFK
mgnify:CR=1 FL=1